LWLAVGVEKIETGGERFQIWDPGTLCYTHPLANRRASPRR